MRRIGVIAAGNTPSDQEAQDALELLSGLYAQMFAEGLFGRIETITANENMTVTDSLRIIREYSVSTISVSDTANDLTAVIIANPSQSTVSRWIFDLTANEWRSITDLNLTDPAPLADRDPTGLSCLLATEIADEWGQRTTAKTNENAAKFRRHLANNFGEPFKPNQAEYF